MTPDEQSEAYARIVFHYPWLCEPRDPVARDDKAILAWLVERPVRLYLLLSMYARDHFLQALEATWPTVATGVANDPVLNAIDAQNAPTLFGRAGYEQKARAARIKRVSLLRNMVIHLWRSGGKQIIDGGTDFSEFVRERHHDLANAEAAILGICEQVVRRPFASDAELVERARRTEARRGAQRMTQYTAEQLAMWAQHAIVERLVPEARRRARTHPLDQLLADAEEQWRREGMTNAQIAEARVELADTVAPR